MINLDRIKDGRRGCPRCGRIADCYCLVHKTYVCLECIKKAHPVCVVRTLSEYILDDMAEFEWPPKCCYCNAPFADGNTRRLGCLHVIHTQCLAAYLEIVPHQQTSPARYDCPVCSTPIWPPRFIADPESSIYCDLKSSLTEDVLGEVPITPANSFDLLESGRMKLTEEIKRFDIAKGVYTALKPKIRAEKIFTVLDDDQSKFFCRFVPDFSGTVFAHKDVTEEAFIEHKGKQLHAKLKRYRWHVS